MPEEEILDNKVWQQMRVIEYFNQTPTVQFMEPEVEADDVISYVKNSSIFEEWQKVVVSADKDFIQLLDEKTLLFRPIQKEVLNINSVIEKYAIHPRNFATARAFAGDPSDNLQGVPRVGLNTIAKRFPFLKEDKDYFVKDVIQACKEEECNLKVYENILKFEETVEQNYNIMQLSSPQMSIQCKNKVDETLSGFTPHFNLTEMRKHMIHDGVLTVTTTDLEQKFNDIISSFVV